VGYIVYDLGPQLFPYAANHVGMIVWIVTSRYALEYNRMVEIKSDRQEPIRIAPQPRLQSQQIGVFLLVVATTAGNGSWVIHVSPELRFRMLPADLVAKILLLVHGECSANTRLLLLMAHYSLGLTYRDLHSHHRCDLLSHFAQAEHEVWGRGEGSTMGVPFIIHVWTPPEHEQREVPTRDQVSSLRLGRPKLIIGRLEKLVIDNLLVLNITTDVDNAER
jgi:hypothetical protein